MAKLRPAKNKKTLRDNVHKAVDRYIKNLDGEEISGLYELVLNEVEQPLLEVVMKHTDGNQSRTATILGLNRGTLRKKLKQYDLI